MIAFLQILQLILAVSIIGLTLIQGKGGGLSSSMGGSIASYGSRRGVEKVVLYATVAAIVTLVAISIVTILIS